MTFFKACMIGGCLLVLAGCQVQGPEVSTPVEGKPAPGVQTDCRADLAVSDRGNTRYAWLYVTNETTSKVEVTAERRWTYQGRRLTDTRVFNLAPKESREVFSFPRNQSPSLRILHCARL